MQPFPVKLHKNAPFLIKAGHTICPDLLLVVDAWRY